ncbi:hypothetical protein SUGI_0537470 [Cryptomeria japonica]|nr:hypothetical protein SUGI_0537470 [Cryptomeria japonica]
MVHHFGLSCMCRDKSFQVQCRRLFHTDDRVGDAVWRLVTSILGGGRHWCDGFVYEVVLCPMVDVLDSKETCIQKINGFICSMDGQAIANEILNLDLSNWVSLSLLGLYFNSSNYISSDFEEDPDDEGEEYEQEKAEKERKKTLIEDAWEVYRIGVINRNLAPFQRMLDEGDGWLSMASVVKVVEIGEYLAIILQALSN